MRKTTKDALESVRICDLFLHMYAFSLLFGLLLLSVAKGEYVLTKFFSVHTYSVTIFVSMGVLSVLFVQMFYLIAFNKFCGL